jgi:hypothetical protein
MRKVNEVLDKIFNYIPGYVFGLLTFIIQLVGIIIALLINALLLPSGLEYIMWKQSISLLGISTGGIFLRIGMIISNIFSVPFIIFLGRSVKDDNVNDNMKKLAISAGIFSSVSAILTGVFTGDDPLISDIHGIFAFLSWIGAAITCFIFGFMMLKSYIFPKKLSTISITVGGIFGAYLIPFFITIICSYICYSFGVMVYMIMPVWEWTLIFSILLWYFFNSIFLRFKRLNNLNDE